MITVQEFTPIFSSEAQLLVDQGSLCGGVETAPHAVDALLRFQACYDDGQVIAVEELSQPFEMCIEEYNDWHRWDV